MTNYDQLPDDYYEDDYYDEYDGLCESCPRCNRMYDEIDFEYQICSKCGWEAKRPTTVDFIRGDADIATGRWI